MVMKVFKVLLIAMLVSPMALAQDAFDLDAWIEKNYINDQNYHFKVAVFASDFNSKSEFVPAAVTAEEIEAASMFKLVDTSNLAWNYKINARRLVKMSAHEKIQALVDANYFLFVPEKGKLVFARRGEAGKLTELFSGRLSPEWTWSQRFIWIQKRFGWDGVVLDASGSQFIAAAPAAFFKEDIQALAIAKSERSEIMAPSERTGAGLLSVVKAKNGFALFESIFVDNNAKIVPGTKLIIERRRK